MKNRFVRMVLGAAFAVAMATGTARAQLAPNQTAGYSLGKLFTFTYTENFDCVDQPTDDLNFNGILAQSDPGEFQIPICQEGDEPTRDPVGAPISTTDKIYVMVPFFSADGDTNPNDAISCDGVLPGTLCGADLGNTLISLFHMLPEGFKQTPKVDVQCPAPGEAPGTCTMHASRLDLWPVLSALGKVSGTPTNIYLPTPNHSHVINVDEFQPTPVWWQVVTVLVYNQSDWPSADGKSGISTLSALRKAQGTGDASADIPSNFFLFFGSHPMASMNMGGH
ncbi:MAG: hypothetical protein IVW56_02220 [Candidatus Binataceae bacterium]|nr:hypothetical protein [Candidatus Binataceae bacterium]